VNPVFTKDAPTKGFLPGEISETNAERPRDVLAAYYFESAQNCPAVLKLREDPALRSIASAYLGQPALLIRTRLWWSFPAERVSDGDLHLAAQNHFHFDIDGWLHGRMAVMRGVESGFTVARAAKQGLFIISDNRGRILAEKSSSVGTFSLLQAIAPVRHEKTLYVRWGNSFAWLNIAGVLVIVSTFFSSKPGE